MNRSEDDDFDTWLREADTDLTASVAASLDTENMLMHVKQRVVSEQAAPVDDISPVSATRRQVFLSFASEDREVVIRFSQYLRECGIDAFVDEQLVRAGDYIVLSVNRALKESDYYVLLWSRASVGHPWLEAEYSAALAHELMERRSFLFIVRLDETPLPVLLTPRRYLDAFSGDWREVVNELASAWHRDHAVGVPVLPAPHPTVHTAEHARSALRLYVRNQALSVAHMIAAPAQTTGHELLSLVRAGLALPDVVSEFGGAVGMRFFYQLKYLGEPIPDKALDMLQIKDDATIDLEVMAQAFGPDGSSPVITYLRDASTELPSRTARSLIDSSFGHLMSKVS